MNKIFCCVIILMLTSAFVSPVCAQFANTPITDNAGYLTESELNSLSAELNSLREKYDFDVAIYTEYDMTSDSAQESADDIYDYNGYGAGSNSDGIILYICSGTREYHFSTHGYGLSAFNPNGLTYLESKVIPYLSENNYYKAFKTYAEVSEELLELAKNGTPYDESHYSTEYLLGVIAAAILIPLIIAFLMMSNKLSKMKTAVKNDYAANYMKPGSMNIAVSKDIFLYSVVTKTEKPKSNSGTHTSSSGRTHGGRGGSF